MIPRKPYHPDTPPEIAGPFERRGIRLLGIAAAHSAEEEERRYHQWIAEGRHGSMQYLAHHSELKFHPDRILPGCRSIIFCGLNYYQQPPGRGSEEGGAVADRGRIARYAWGRDYHKVLGGRLRRIVGELSARYPGDRFRSFTDATPLAERYYAEKAGIGFSGRNTLLISSSFGSWFLLGEILTTLELPPSGDAGMNHGSCPASCSRCIRVCPTGALLGPHRIDASRCISCLTIEHKGSIPEELRPEIGNWLFGCDLCQEVCPLNVRARVTEVEDFLKVNAGDTLALREILSIRDDESFTRRFAGSPLMRARREGLVRNACIVSANLLARELLPLLRELADDPNPVIAEHARWAVARLELNRAAGSPIRPPGYRPAIPTVSRLAPFLPFLLPECSPPISFMNPDTTCGSKSIPEFACTYPKARSSDQAAR